MVDLLPRGDLRGAPEPPAPLSPAAPLLRAAPGAALRGREGGRLAPAPPPPTEEALGDSGPPQGAHRLASPGASAPPRPGAERRDRLSAAASAGTRLAGTGRHSDACRSALSFPFTFPFPSRAAEGEHWPQPQPPGWL